MARNKKDDNKKPENNEGIQITPPDSIEKETVEMCILCEKNPAYKTATVDSDLCEECRQGFLYTPINWKGIVAICLVFLTIISGIIVSVPQAPAVTTVRDTYKNVKTGNYETALGGISDIATQGLMGWKAAGTLAEICHKINLPNDFTFLMDSFFYDKTADDKLQWQDIAGKGDLNASWNKDLKAKYTYLKNIEKLAEEKSVLFTDYYNQFQSGMIELKDIPYDDIINQYKAQFAAATTNEEKGIISYYMLAISSVCEKDIKTQLGYCKSIQQHIPTCYWLYIDNLITLSIQAGEYAQAQNNINTLSTLNSTDKNYAKRYTAMMYRYQGKYKESLTILKELIANIDSNGLYETFYEAALCELLTGNLDGAYEYIIPCIEYEYHTSYESINLYALLSKHFGDEEGYTLASDIFEQYGMELSPTVEKYIKGEITIDQLFKNGEVVFE